ncbi:hypothetical protein BX666DRAFT_2016709 [Dichotomocladium elegans]|nr:hypothetical protein BX666DRAFT_2016709 [Dichotomocladium elegans]
MPSGKMNQLLLQNLSFGDLTREEINAVLELAGESLTPPKKTPFATGICKKKRTPKHADAEPPSPSTARPPSTPKPSVAPTVANGTTDSLPPTPAINEQQEITIVNGSKVTAVAAPPPSKPKMMSWAAVARPSSGQSTPAKAHTASATASPTKAATVRSPQTTMPSSISATPSGKQFMGIADIISRFEPCFTAPLLEPRGLINNVNTCFMNVILQPLSHCPPFYNLLKTIGTHVVLSLKSKTPLLDSMIEFINEFRPEPPANGKEQNLEPYGEPFVPEYVYDALRGQKRFDSLRGRQEDAEEFLCFLLDGLHEEMVAVLKEKKLANDQSANTNGNGWFEVGTNKKTSSLQAAGFEESPISKLFGGNMRSTLQCHGAKDSITYEPFQSLPLDIQPDNVGSIEDAIRNITIPETMHDFMSPKGIRGDATKQVFLEILPPVLVLHMKRFVFDNVGGVQKLQKPVRYGAQLTIQPDWMAPRHRTNAPITYKLFGIVYHHGSSAGGGHYTCDIRRQNGQWLHINDTNIKPVSERDVLLTEQNTRAINTIHTEQTPYILFYMKA